MHSTSVSQVSSDLIGPMEILVSATRVQKNSALFTIRCVGHSKFTDGTLILRAGRFKSHQVDSVGLWRGNSDTDRFDQSFNYALSLPEGKKANVVVMFQGRVPGVDYMYTTKGDLSVYQLPDTLLQTEGDYNFLDWVEIDYLIKKKGYDGKSEDEIRAIDPNFWKRIQYVKHGHGRKNKK